jgi:hypothetical protein
MEKIGGIVLDLVGKMNQRAEKDKESKDRV